MGACIGVLQLVECSTSWELVKGYPSYFLYILLLYIYYCIFQIALDVNEFRTNDVDALPILHFILHITDGGNWNPFTGPSPLVSFLSNLTTKNSFFINTNPTYGLDCTLQDSSGQKDGETFPRQATKLLCAACFEGDVKVVKGLLAAGTAINMCDRYDQCPCMHPQAG